MRERLHALHDGKSMSHGWCEREGDKRIQWIGIMSQNGEEENVDGQSWKHNVHTELCSAVVCHLHPAITRKTNLIQWRRDSSARPPIMQSIFQMPDHLHSTPLHKYQICMKKICVRARVRYTTTVWFTVFALCSRFRGANMQRRAYSLDCNLRVHNGTVLILMWKYNSIGLGHSEWWQCTIFYW